MKNNEKKQKHPLLRLVAGLPLGTLYIVSDLTFFFVYYIVRYRRRLVRENLTCSFPDKDAHEIRRIERAFYHNLCDVFIESFKLLNISDEELRRRVDVQNTELVERLAGEGKNVFMLLGHLGCWEWYQEVSVRYRQPKKGGEIYKHISSPYFSSLMHEIRSRWDTEQVEMRQVVRTLLQWKSQGELFLMGFIQDQRPEGRAKDGVHFLNQTTWYTPGAEEIARKTGAELVYLDVMKTSRGCYRLTFRPLLPTEEEQSTPYPLSRAYWRELEQSICRQPELWLWSHNRWYKWEIHDSEKSLMHKIRKRLRKNSTS